MNENAFFNCERSTLELYYCKYCVFKTDIEVFLWDHCQIFHAKNNKSPFKSYCPANLCKNCNFSTFSPLLLLKHNLNCQGNDKKKSIIVKYECSFCQYKARRILNLKHHIIRKHTSPENFEWYNCNHCDYKGKNQIGFLQHIIVQHTRKSKEEVLLYHCDKCDLKTIYKHYLKYHIITKHAKLEEIQWHQCKRCTYRSKTKFDLKRHEKIHNKEKKKNSVSLVKQTSRKNIPKYKCNTCNYNAIRKGHLESHIIRHHRASEVIQCYQCEHCIYTTQSKSHLSTHMNTKHHNIINVVAKSYLFLHSKLPTSRK